MIQAGDVSPVQSKIECNRVQGIAFTNPVISITSMGIPTLLCLGLLRRLRVHMACGNQARQQDEKNQ